VFDPGGERVMLRLNGMSSNRILWFVPLYFSFFLNTSCYQNPGFTAPAVAPPPGTVALPSGVPALPPPPYTGIPGAPGVFTPVLPPGMPSQFYPFLPVYSYFNQNPSLQGYWSGMWNQWLQYAYVNGYDQFNFIPFWYDFCPTVLATGALSEVYSFFNYNVYGWMNPQMVFPPSVSPAVFWQYYVGMPFSGI
jgi:hypothetical protein